MLLEICASNYQSAINAQEAGAHRIELCQELAIGGITPSYGFLKQVLEQLSIPVYVLIRPRSGNFTYSDEEFNIMKENITLCKELGASGIVSGILNIDNTIDIERTRELIELSNPLPFTFHRAFDWTPDPIEALEQLKHLKVKRVLSSGQNTTAEKGLELLNQLKAIAKSRLIILPGGSINATNAKLFKDNGFSEIHASASTIETVSETPKVSMNSTKFLSDTDIYFSNSKNIKSILSSINA